ncbi:hypothetical protein AQUCO_07600096v1 [Aquilegia coerulea]|uniref:Cytochrome P450 n=1 Tax=Aquilegia coerulea TaxID=218851 RepID=A0A2G5C8V0_AQUCA|nr:hypothetical protein AQUCO_07600096v1 [Aquilegia coerulea]
MNGFLFIALVVSSCLLLRFSVKTFHSLWWKPKRLEKRLKKLGIKGTSYRFLFGDLKDYARLMDATSYKPLSLNHHISPRVSPFITEAVKTFGKIPLFWFATRPTLIITDPGLVKEVLSGKKLVTPAFHLRKLKAMTPAFLASCTDLIEQWKKFVAPDGSCELDVWPEIQNLTADVISRTAFGSNFEEGKRVFELQKQQMALVMEAVRSVYLPGFRFIPTTKNRRRMYLDKEIKANLRDLVQRKLSAMENGESGADDLLGMLLLNCKQSPLSTDTIDPENDGMTIEEVIEECKLFYFAGQDTTSNLLTKAREEVQQICGKNVPSLENLNHLKIVTMILYEVLRLYPAAVNQWRYIVKETEIGNISLPAGVQLLLSVLLVQRDLEVWGNDAEEFRPDRFSEGIAKAAKDQVAFFAFGWGPRSCLGQNFAMIEARMAMAMILQHFSFELSPSYIHAPHIVITLKPQHGAQIILHAL